MDIWPHADGVALWTIRGVSCTLIMHPDDQIEIRLVVSGVVIHRQFFPDPKSAADFAIEKMRAYNAC